MRFRTEARSSIAADADRGIPGTGKLPHQHSANRHKWNASCAYLLLADRTRLPPLSDSKSAASPVDRKLEAGKRKRGHICVPAERSIQLSRNVATGEDAGPVPLYHEQSAIPVLGARQVVCSEEIGAYGGE